MCLVPLRPSFQTQSYFILYIDTNRYVISQITPHLFCCFLGVKHCRYNYNVHFVGLCFRYLATGESFRSIAFNFRVGETTVSNIVAEVCEALWEKLSPIYMPPVLETSDWELVAANFEQRWNFPHCLGSIDGKHIVLETPRNSGSLYRNYKGSFSIVLLALVDANYRFVCIDVGSYGRNSDGGTFSRSNFGKSLAAGSLQLPTAEPLPNANHLGPLPYVFIGDEAFPLQRHVLRPYPGRGCTINDQVFNYRLSRARRVVENAFGILAVRWRVFYTKIDVRPKWATLMVKATCVLHNFLQSQSTPRQINTLVQDAASLGNPVGM